MTGRELKPIIVISKCLGFAACRYNGVAIDVPFVTRMKPHVEFITVCPEMEIGLGVPRDPIRVIRDGESDRLVQPSTGRDVSRDMTNFAEQWLDGIQQVHGFLLKSRSPSCGIKDVKLFASPHAHAPTGKTQGFFARAVQSRFPGAAIEDEGRLTNWRIREDFLARVFALAAFDGIRRKSMGSLVQYHSRQKLLLSAHSQKEMRILGKIVANLEKRPLEEVFADYRAHLALAMARPARPSANADVLLHAFGHFSKRLSRKEKTHFLTLLEQYRAGKTPLSALQSILKSWAVRFENDYLGQQSFFAPYPA